MRRKAAIAIRSGTKLGQNAKALRLLTVCTLLLVSCSHLTTEGAESLSEGIDDPFLAQQQILTFEDLAYEASYEVTNELDGYRTANYIPNRLNWQLRSIFYQAQRRQPLLKADNFYLSESTQLVNLDNVNRETNGLYGLFTFTYLSPENTEMNWIVRLILDMEKWQVVDWEVNLHLDGSYWSAENYFPSTDEETAYRRKVNLGPSPLKLEESEWVTALVRPAY